jgi:uncharacterized repeat protein (TIGR01451 family)
VGIIQGEAVQTKNTAGRTFRKTATRTAGVACLISSAVLAMATTFVSPGANASEATDVKIVPFAVDGLGKRDKFTELDMLIQDEALLNDGQTFSDADPMSAMTPPIDEISFAERKAGRTYLDVKQAGIPTFFEGETATFRVRVYPRFWGLKADGTSFLSNNDVTVKTVTDNATTPALNCDLSQPVNVIAEGGLIYTCTVPNVVARDLNTKEDLIHTITVTRVANEDPTKTPLTLSESAAINVVRPCIGIKKEVRALGSSDAWVDAQTADAALLVANGGSVEYRITVTNCGETDLTEVTVTDTLPGCNRTIAGTLAVGASSSYTTKDAGAEGCISTSITGPISSTASVTGIATLTNRTKTVSAADPVNVNIKTTVVPTTAAPTTAAPTTAAPTTAAPTTAAPTTAAPTTAGPTTVATTAAPTTVATTTVGPTTVAPTTVAPTTVAPTTVAPTTEAPTTVATTVATTAAPTTVATTVATTAAPTTVATTVATTKASTTVATVPPTIAPSGCIGLKKYVRQAGTNGPWLDAQDPANAALIAFGADAEYQIVVNNCGTTDLVDVVVTDSITGCAKNIGGLPVRTAFEYTTASSGNGACKTSPVVVPVCSAATVTAQPIFNGAVFGPKLSVSDPACITTVAPATTAAAAAPTTAVPAPTAAPTTLAPVPTTAPQVQVLDNVIAKESEPTENLGVTGRNTQPLTNGAIALFLSGLVLVTVSRRQPTVRHGQKARS